MKLLFVLEHYYPYIGGAEKLFKGIAEKLAARDHEVSVVTTRFRGKLAPEEEKNGVHITRLSLANRFLFTFFGFFGVIKHARKTDLIITTSYNAAVPAWIAALITRKKSVIIFHEVWGSLWFSLPHLSRVQQIAFFTFEQLILRMPFNHYVAVSDFTRNRLIKHGITANKITRIHNGVDYRDFSKPDQLKKSGTFTYTFFGRLGVSKGIEMIIEATHLLQKEGRDVRFKLIIPTYPRYLFKLIRGMIRGTEIEPMVTFMHNLPKDKLKEELASSDCVIIPSYSEGFCFTAAEAVAMGIPVISSSNGALPEVVGGKHLFFSPFDAGGLYEALKRARANDWEFRDPKRFELNESIDQYMLLIQRLKA